MENTNTKTLEYQCFDIQTGIKFELDFIDNEESHFEFSLEPILHFQNLVKNISILIKIEPLLQTITILFVSDFSLFVYCFICDLQYTH